MILQKNEEVVKEMGFDDSISMGVDKEDMSKIFRILSTSVYVDKPGSIVREYVSNCVDAHTAVGKLDEPVYLKYEDGYIYFIDNGRGMSPKIIREVYSKLGKSDKGSDANMIGGFGVGRFSLHSYVDMFEISTRFDGIQYDYAVVKNDETAPDILPLNEEPTSEGNGTTIRFKLENTEKDFPIFKAAIQNQLKYFRNIITLNMGLNNDYKIIQGKNFIWRTDSTNTNGLEIAWGNITYPIDWDMIGIPKINVNCAIYFPTTTPFTPTVSRERLDKTEGNKKLILEKIKEAKQELYEMWKDQQIVEDFFDFYNKSGKTIVIGEHTLNVTPIIDEEYIWKPLIGTHVNPKIFKNAVARGVLDKLFFKKNNSRKWQTDWQYVGKNKYLFYTSSTMPSSRLAKAGWHGCIQKRDGYYFTNFIHDVYDKDLVKLDKDPNDPRSYVIVDPGFDYKKEISIIIDGVWSSIQTHCVDLHSLDLGRAKGERIKIEDEEVRGRFSTDAYSHKYNVRKLSYINQYKYVVYTSDETEYNNLCGLNIVGYNNKTKSKGNRYRWNTKNTIERDRKHIDKFYLVILCANKYHKRLSHHYSYEQFLETDVLKKYYFKCVQKKNIKDTWSHEQTLGTWNKIHELYKVKFSHLKEDLQTIRNISNGNYYINYNLEKILSEKYPIIPEKYRTFDKYYSHIERLKKYLNAEENNSVTLKYKLLYNFYRKKAKQNEVKA